MDKSTCLNFERVQLVSLRSFPTSVENMGGGEEWLKGGGLKMLSKNTCEGVHLIVKLPAIILQACKFTKN